MQIPPTVTGLVSALWLRYKGGQYLTAFSEEISPNFRSGYETPSASPLFPSCILKYSQITPLITILSKVYSVQVTGNIPTFVSGTVLKLNMPRYKLCRI